MNHTEWVRGEDSESGAAAWLTDSDRILARLSRAGWGTFSPRIEKLSWRALLRHPSDRTILGEMDYRYPDLPDEAVIVGAIGHGEELTAALRWARDGGTIPLCPAERIAEARQAPRFTVVFGGDPNWTAPTALIYAFGIGLFRSDARPGHALSLEEAERFRSLARLRSGGRGEGTSLSSDGFWNK